MKTVGLLAPAPGRSSRFFLACVLLVLLASDTSVVSRAWYDLKVQSFASDSSAEGSVVIIDIDDATLNSVGRWPWPRDDFAALLSLLADNYSPNKIVVNFLFPEPSDLDDDSALIALTEDPRFMFAVAFDFESNRRVGTLPPSNSDRAALMLENVSPATGWVGMHSTLAEKLNDARVGHVNLLEDPDGVVRRIPGLVEADGSIYGSLPQKLVPLQATRHVTERGEALIPYLSDLSQIMTVSALDVLSGSVPTSFLANQILLVGTSASGLGHRVITPLGYAVPGIIVQGLVVKSWQAGEFWFERPLFSDAFLIIALGILIGGIACSARLASTQALAVIVGFGVVALVINWFDHAVFGAVWDPAPFAIACGCLALAQAYHLFELQKLATSRVRAMFESYVPETVVEKLLSGDLERFDRGERLRVTILFADLVGFTSMAERLPPDQLTATVRGVFNQLTAVILECGGTVDKYMGDAVMAFWGAPIPDDEQETHAVNCAIKMQDTIAKFRDDLTLSIGVNTGVATVGNMGSDFRHAYSVLGDTVNVAARLESQTRELKKNILLGKRTAIACSVPTMSMGEIWVKGKLESVEVFCLDV